MNKYIRMLRSASWRSFNKTHEGSRAEKRRLWKAQQKENGTWR